MTLTRRALMTAGPGALVASVAPGAIAGQDAAPPCAAADALYPTQDPARVREIVGASHRSLARVKELLAACPALARAAWDWGFGDWETALGAASHTGQREIAALLIEHGARPDLFTFAMLGQLDVVRAAIEANPGLQRLHGPHGITLLKHAQAGGEKSAALAAYLTQLGGADEGYAVVPIPAPWAERYVGEYSFGPRAQDRFAIAAGRRADLTIRRGAGGSDQRLFHLGEHRFHPAGAPRVVIRFAIRSDAVVGLSVEDGGSRVSAERMQT